MENIQAKDELEKFGWKDGGGLSATSYSMADHLSYVEGSELIRIRREAVRTVALMRNHAHID